jgi:CRISPR-associated protein Csx17
MGLSEEVLASQTGATRVDLADFVDGVTDDARIGDLLAGLVCVDLRGVGVFGAASGQALAALPPAFALLKVFFTPESVLRKLNWLPEDRSLRLPAEIPSRLASNDAQTAVRIAWNRLQSLGIQLPGRVPPKVVTVDGSRWLAALCIPLTFGETARMLRELNLEFKNVEPLS